MRIFLFLFFVTSLGFSQNTPVYSSLLAPGQTINFEGRSLKFKKVLSDSRCPKGTTCIWAGEAKVIVEVFQHGKLVEERVISLGEAANLPTDLFGDKSFQISKFRLTPYPEISEKIPASHYRLMMEVSKEEEI
ncbi:MAG TPA: hypothetical protein VLO29_04095 [Salegentibacter sp.]|nr:hypothetical protein [Salegentibacter sp.]